MLVFLCGDGTWSFPFPNGYAIFINTPFWEIRKNGTTVGADFNESMTTGVHTIRLEHNGSGGLTVYSDAVLKMSRTDGGTVLTGGYTGMGAGGSSVMHFDNFSGGDLTPLNPVYIKTSTNITAGGEPTTAQLIPPVTIDSFTGTNGAAWSPAVWASTGVGATSVIDIQSNAGRMLSQGADYTYSRALSVASYGATDVTFSVSFNSASEKYLMLHFRSSATWGASGDPAVLSDSYLVEYAVADGTLSFFWTFLSYGFETPGVRPGSRWVDPLPSRWTWVPAMVAAKSQDVARQRLTATGT